METAARACMWVIARSTHMPVRVRATDAYLPNIETEGH
jgi:hypothetical protein